jgi:hypothetical protein
MPKTAIDIARLEADFDQQPKRVFSSSDLASFAVSRQFDWDLSRKMGPDAFIDLLLERTKMMRIKLKSQDYPQVVRYLWGSNIAPVLVALSIKPHSYCSHGSALWVHGLGGQERQIYVNSEQSQKPGNRNQLAQDAIDRAFLRPQRKSRLVYTYENATIVVLNGKHSGRLEVERAKTPSGEEVEATSLERTLVDITVRPSYAGGVASVVKSFQIARGKASVERLLRILGTLEYAYPYHQSIGFYMRQSYYSETELDLVRRLGTKYNFYLDYGMKDRAFDGEFKVFYPKSIG